MPKNARALIIEFNVHEMQEIRRVAGREYRTPENLVRYLIVKALGFECEGHKVPNAFESSDQDESSA